jgi:hypothetical protein
MDRISSEAVARGEAKEAHHPIFEETYPRYEFAELVRLALAAAAWATGLRRRVGRRRRDASSRPLPGEMRPAE